MPVLHAELYDDVATWSRSHSGPWRPVPAQPDRSPFGAREGDERSDVFAVVTLDEGDLVGDALLWGIDSHNRMAHVGVSLIPAFHGRGYGSDVVRVLCHHGFAVRGLHRLQVDTLADNAAMIAAAEKVGFVAEGTLRRSAWVDGEFVDEVILGLLAAEWTAKYSA
jgi:RimJ/RimL family protein N-acetyltransferase